MNTAYSKLIEDSKRFSKQHTIKAIPCTAVIDTGIFPHKDIASNIKGFFDPVNARNTPYDDNGHGTHIAGIISSIFPNCDLFGVKTLNAEGTGKIKHFIEGTNYLVAHKDTFNIRVINISLGTKWDNSKEQIDLIDCVEHAWDSGIFVCAAAGNNGPGRGSITIPGISKKVITIGTYDDNNYSGRGPTKDCIVKPDILCPGEQILSLRNSYSGYAFKSGTSMSTPMVAGLASLVIAIHPDITPKELKKAIREAHLSNSLAFDSQLFFSKF